MNANEDHRPIRASLVGGPGMPCRRDGSAPGAWPITAKTVFADGNLEKLLFASSSRRRPESTFLFPNGGMDSSLRRNDRIQALFEVS